MGTKPTEAHLETSLHRAKFLNRPLLQLYRQKVSKNNNIIQMAYLCMNKFWQKTLMSLIIFCASLTKFTRIRKTTKTPWRKSPQSCIKLRLTMKTFTTSSERVTSWLIRNWTQLPMNTQACCMIWICWRRCLNKVDGEDLSLWAWRQTAKITMNQTLTAGEHPTKEGIVKGAVATGTVLREEILIKTLQETAASVTAGKQVIKAQIGWT